MGDSVEVELKLEFDPADRDRLLASPLLKAGCGGQLRQLIATYFDTPDLQLSKAGYALRIREENGRRIQTVKASDGKAAGLFVRGEWEVAVEGNRPILDETAGPLGQMLAADAIRRIEPIFSTAVERHGGLIARGDALIDYAIDQGEVRAGQRGTSLSELELELKQGTPGALFEIARSLGETVPLRLGVLSKSARGYALAGSAPPPAHKAEPVTLDREMRAGTAFAAIAVACIRHYRLNEALLLEGGGAEAVHQARVALRRLRSAFSLFKPLLAGDRQAGSLVAELRWLAGQLGDIRDIDVLLPRIGDEAARAALSVIRDARLGHLRGLLDSGRVRTLPIALCEWLEIGHWRNEPSDHSLHEQAIPDFAERQLDRLRERIRREGRWIADIGDEPRHEVRKDAKKLRYAAEFVAGLYPGKARRRRLDAMLDHIADLQEVLGQLNDIAAAPALIARLGLDIALPEVGKKERKRLLGRAEDLFEALIDTERFWRA